MCAEVALLRSSLTMPEPQRLQACVLSTPAVTPKAPIHRSGLGGLPGSTEMFGVEAGLKSKGSFGETHWPSSPGSGSWEQARGQ